MQLLTVLESVYSFRLYFAYIRTYHNLTADALTREEPTQVMRSKGLKDLKGVEGFLLQLLNRGWLKRAFIWGAQRDGGRSCALRLATLRTGVRPLPAMEPSPPLNLSVTELRPGLGRYVRTFGALGAKVSALDPGPDADATLSKQKPPGRPDLLVCSFVPFSLSPEELACGAFRARAKALWTDCLTQEP